MILVARISYIDIICYLLSKTHFEDWRKLYVETTIHHLLEQINTAQNKDKIVSFLTMNVFRLTLIHLINVYYIFCVKEKLIERL